MSNRLDIPRKSVYRLSIYQRCLVNISKGGAETVSSEALAKAAGVKPAQLRKDIAHCGQFGTRGLGYSVETLKCMIDDVLGTTRLQPVILIGVGNLGAALLRYDGFQKEGFEITAAFDLAPEDSHARGVALPIFGMGELSGYIKANQVKMAILTVPATAAQDVVNQVVEAGIQAILNFSPLVLQVPPHVTVNNVDLAMELENLSYFIR